MATDMGLAGGGCHTTTCAQDGCHTTTCAQEVECHASGAPVLPPGARVRTRGRVARCERFRAWYFWCHRMEGFCTYVSRFTFLLDACLHSGVIFNGFEWIEELQ